MGRFCPQSDKKGAHSSSQASSRRLTNPKSGKSGNEEPKVKVKVEPNVKMEPNVKAGRKVSAGSDGSLKSREVTSGV